MDLDISWRVSSARCIYITVGFPGGSSGKEHAYKCKRRRFNPWVGKILWRRRWQLTPVFLPGETQGQRSLVDHGVTKSGMWLSTCMHTYLYYCINFLLSFMKIQVQRATYRHHCSFQEVSGSCQKVSCFMMGSFLFSIKIVTYMNICIADQICVVIEYDISHSNSQRHKFKYANANLYIYFK